MKKDKEEKHWLSDLGFCKHKWKFIRTESSYYCVKDVCECIYCGKRKAFKVW